MSSTDLDQEAEENEALTELEGAEEDGSDNDLSEEAKEVSIQYYNLRY